MISSFRHENKPNKYYRRNEGRVQCRHKRQCSAVQCRYQIQCFSVQTYSAVQCSAVQCIHTLQCSGVRGRNICPAGGACCQQRQGGDTHQQSLMRNTLILISSHSLETHSHLLVVTHERHTHTQQQSHKKHTHVLSLNRDTLILTYIGPYRILDWQAIDRQAIDRQARLHTVGLCTQITRVRMNGGVVQSIISQGPTEINISSRKFLFYLWKPPNPLVS